MRPLSFNGQPAQRSFRNFTDPAGVNVKLDLRVKTWFFILPLALAATGCISKSTARLREQNAYLAGQNTILQQQQAQTAAQSPGVTIVGAVQHPQVPWITGMTLAQAISTANYVGQEAPKQVILTRHGESAAMDANVLLNGQDVPLEIGDVIELR
jgi:hypothetical protein